MIDRVLTRDLRKRYRQNVVTPVILRARADRYENLKQELAEIRRGMEPLGLGILQRPQIGLFGYKELPRFNMLAIPLTANLIEELSESPKIEKMYPDYLKYALQDGVWQDKLGKPFTSTSYTRKIIGVEQANKEGYRGEGVKVVVVDSGVRTTHPMARGMIARTAAPEKLFSGEDFNGHGTWCATCIAGKYNIDPTYKIVVEGMSPNADLIGIQALGFLIGAGSSSDVMAAMSMAIDYGADIVSMSLGSNDAPPDAENPECVVVNELVKHDVIVVVAAGNSGPDSKTVGSPGSCLQSLTIGAWDSINNKLADFSSRGPTSGDGYTKPDCVAPGFRILSGTVGLIDSMEPGHPKYASISGTSMATPHASGLLALCRQLYAKHGILLTADMVKKAMETYGYKKNNDTGWGAITWDIMTKHMLKLIGLPKYKYWYED